ncbi:MAG: formate/nitrite transporter family protein [Pseudomonadota bacterium]|nr:formate/nitrite transporter family protein [Pseudomonadota bacterium]
MSDASRADEADEQTDAAKSDQEEADRVERNTTPRTPVIYETVRRSGEDEMARPPVSLWWSGLAAGLSISFSLFAEAVLHSHLPAAPWRELVVALGYPIGFMIVILGRQQLFTENTITVVLPVIAKFNILRLGIAGRLWGIVLVANLCGTLIAAVFCTYTPVLSNEVRASMLEISRHAVLLPWLEVLLRGITAGFLMAALVWLMPAAGDSHFSVVFVITYLIGVAGTAHIVAGSAEAFMLMLHGELSVASVALGFGVPALLGNIIGGTALFAVIAYAQVMHEIDPEPAD